MADIQVVVNAKTDAAQKEFLKLEQRQIEVEAATKKMIQAQKALEAQTKKLKTATEESTKPFVSLIKTGMQFMGVGSAIGAATSAMRAFEERTQAAGNAVNQLIEKSTGLYMVSDNPKIGAQAGLHGARFGIGPEQSREIYARALSRMQGDEQKAMQMADAMMLMQRFGTKTEDSTTAILSGTARGLTPQQVADLSVFHANASDLETSDIARVMPQAAGFSSVDVGLAAASAASRSAPREQLPTVVGNIAKGLRTDNPLTLEVARRFGKQRASDLTEAQMAKGIQDTMGIANASDWTKYAAFGVKEKEVSQALAWFEQNADFFVEQTAAQKPAGYAQNLMAQKQAQFPEMQRQQETAEIAALTQAKRTIGSRAAEKQRITIENAESGLALESAGLGFMTDDKGLAPFFLRPMARASTRLVKSWGKGDYLGAGKEALNLAQMAYSPASVGANYVGKQLLGMNSDNRDIEEITKRLDELNQNSKTQIQATKEQTSTLRTQGVRRDSGQAWIE